MLLFITKSKKANPKSRKKRFHLNPNNSQSDSRWRYIKKFPVSILYSDAAPNIPSPPANIIGINNKIEIKSDIRFALKKSYISFFDS